MTRTTPRRGQAQRRPGWRSDSERDPGRRCAWPRRGTTPSTENFVERIATVHGVDFSGAKLAGRNAWVARCEVVNAGLKLVALDPLERLAGTPDRVPALAHLVSLIRDSRDALWGIDFPFGLPVDILDAGATWRDQLRLVQDWPGEAHAFGLHCVERAKAATLADGVMTAAGHVRRTTDVEQRAPFDCYHYRIIYQTFHGMRDVLAPLAGDAKTVVLPFQYARLNAADRVVVEACPSSTLKRLRLPHQNYKQPAGGPLTAKRRKTKRAILDATAGRIEMTDRHRRTVMRNPGGDALDAVLAAVGAWESVRDADHAAIARHARYRREGYIFG